MKKKWVDAFMDTAERFAQLSSAVRLKVGAVVVKDNRIISIGYNGMPAGWSNECEDTLYPTAFDGDVSKDFPMIDALGRRYTTKTKDEVIHAEANAIAKLARDGESGLGTDVFCTHAPCIQCAKIMYGAGVRKVYYRNTYRDTKGLDFLEKCNIEIERV
jgi:dCMP deaminase